METKLLFPNRFKKVGWVLLVPGLVLTIMSIFSINFNLLDIPKSSFNFFNEGNFFSNWTTVQNVHPIPFFESYEKAPSRYSEDFTGEIVMTLVALGFLLVAFSREKIEDEYIAKVRLESFVWGFYLYVLAFIIIAWTQYQFGFLMLLCWCLLIPPIVFLLRFHWFVYLKPYFESRKEAQS
jgi:hypothetical protein